MQEEITEKDVLELLESRISSLKAELRRTEDALIALKGKSTTGNIETEDKRGALRREKNTISAINKPELPLTYDPNYKWDKKILYVLSKTGTAYKEDIVKEITTLEPRGDSDKLINLIGVKLSALLKTGIIKAKREGRKFRYQLS